MGLILILLRKIWGYAYSNEEEVVNYMAIMLPILAISIVLDAIQAVLSGKKISFNSVLHSLLLYYYVQLNIYLK